MTVVLLTVDCLRADHIGCYGYDRPTTPNIDAFADTATRYKNSYSNCPGTRWAFQSLHTGLPTIRFEGLGIPEEYTSLASLFSQAGYITGGFAVNGYVSRDYDYDSGFDEYYSVREATEKDTLLTKVGKRVEDVIGSKTLHEKVFRPIYRRMRQTSASEETEFVPRHTDADTVDRAIEFIEKNQSADQEFFCWIHFMDAHTPYGYWPEHLEAIRGDTKVKHTIHPGDEGRVTPGHGPDSDVIDTYDACIRCVDEQIGRVLESLSPEASVVLTGDHGEEFGEENERGFHEASLHASMTQVPIIARTSGLEQGPLATPSQHLDVPPTLLAAAGLEVPDHFEGQRLQELEREVDAPIYFSLGPDRMAVRSGEWKYFERDGDTALYRSKHMETESEAVEGNSGMRKQLSNLLKAYRRTETIDAESLQAEADRNLSAEVESNLENLGYR